MTRRGRLLRSVLGGTLLAGTCRRPGCGREFPDAIDGPELAGRVLERTLHVIGACDQAARSWPCFRCGAPTQDKDLGGRTQAGEPVCETCALALDGERGPGGRP